MISATPTLPSLLLLIILSEAPVCRPGSLVAPRGYTALTSDLPLSVAGLAGPGCVRLLAPDPAGRLRPLASVSVAPAPAPATGPMQYLLYGLPADLLLDAGQQVVFSCGVIASGGRFGLRLTEGATCNRDQVDRTAAAGDPLDDNETTESDAGATSTGHPEDEDEWEEGAVPLDVRWPPAELELEPRSVQTYPEEPVVARLRFRTVCEPTIGAQTPETWLDLVYCGHSPDHCLNTTHRQLLYSEQIRGFPALREVVLPCNSFGQAGHYGLALRASFLTTGPVVASSPPDRTLKAEWSSQFVFNVHARSIFPCDGHAGVSVLFQYPACILEQGDRVRVFGRLRADVGSAAPPTTLHYLAERRVARGRHAIAFDCDLFTERFVEYCFAYVSQAVTGAVSDVRVDCVPTLPVNEGSAGGWGAWSAWSTCTTTCSGGTRNRYRLCDSPPPRYGAKFCEGHALQTERCGASLGWDCAFYGEAGGDVPAERPEVRAEVGPGCRCGCVVHLNAARPRRLVAASSQSCPGRAFWLIQADAGASVRLSLEQLRLPCAAQWLKVRDGDALSSPLLGRLAGAPARPPTLASTAHLLLLEFFSDEEVAAGEQCWGGFLAHVRQIVNKTSGGPVSVVARPLGFSPQLPSPAHLAVVLLLIFLVLASTCLVAQYFRRHRKYQLANRDDLDSLALSSGSACSEPVSRSRAASSSTLLSDVISLRRFRPHRHARLADADADEDDVQDLQLDTPLHRARDEEAKVSSEAVEEAELRPSSLDVPVHRGSKPQPRHISRFRGGVSPVDERPEAPDDDVTSGGQPEPSESSLGSHQSASPPQPPGKPGVSGSLASSIATALSSPASSLRSDPKERKERRNRERLLAGSEWSLATDLELDYYDYNVGNAAPGSYLAMDPAYCLWIPPFAPGRWDHEIDKEGEYEETELRDDSGTATPVNSDKSEEGCLVGRLRAASPARVHLAPACRIRAKEGGQEMEKEEEGKKECGKEKEDPESTPTQRKRIQDARDMDDIRFADDDEEELDIKSSPEPETPRIRSNRSSYYDA